MMRRLSITTTKAREIVDITDLIAQTVGEHGATDGICHVFVAHTTAALTTADLDPGTDRDMLDAFAALLPKLRYRHPHDPAHTPDHILASLIGPALSVPVVAGKLVLGEWQRIVLVECSGPRKRTVMTSFVPLSNA